MQNTHSLHNLGVSSPPTNPSQKKYHWLQTTTRDSVSKRTKRGGGRQRPISYTSSSLPTPTLLLSYYIGSLLGCKLWWYNYARRHPKMGWNRRLTARKPAITPHTKEIIKGHWGARSAFLQTFSSYFLSTIFLNPQPFHTIVLILVDRVGEFFLKFSAKYTLLKNCWLHLGLLICEFNRERRTQNLSPTQHTQKEIRNILTSKLRYTRK